MPALYRLLIGAAALIATANADGGTVAVDLSHTGGTSDQHSGAATWVFTTHSGAGQVD